MSSEHSLRSPQVEPALLSSEKNGAADLREIVVFVDGLTEGAGILEFAGVLAEEHDAHLIGVFMQPEPTITQPETFVRGTAIEDVIEAHREEVEASSSSMGYGNFFLAPALAACGSHSSDGF